jgi:hypothetical protein
MMQITTPGNPNVLRVHFGATYGEEEPVAISLFIEIDIRQWHRFAIDTALADLADSAAVIISEDAAKLIIADCNAQLAMLQARRKVLESGPSHVGKAVCEPVGTRTSVDPAIGAALLTHADFTEVV